MAHVLYKVCNSKAPPEKITLENNKKANFIRNNYIRTRYWVDPKSQICISRICIACKKGQGVLDLVSQLISIDSQFTQCPRRVNLWHYSDVTTDLRQDG